MRAPLTRALIVLLGGAGILRAIASCADSEPPPAALFDAGPAPDTGIAVPEPDAGPPVVPCKEGGWCNVALPPDPVSLNGIWGSSASDVWIVGSPDLTLHWDGAAFATAKVNTKSTLFGVWGSGKNDVWTYSSTDAIWHSAGFANGSPNWTPYDAHAREGGAPWIAPIAQMWGSGPNDVWTVGPFASSAATPAPTIWRAGGWNGGKPEWTSLVTGATPDQPEPFSFTGIWGNQADSEVWIVGFGGKTRLATISAGVVTWSPVNSQTSNDLYAVWGSGNGVVWAAGAGGTMRRFARDAGGPWTANLVEFPTTETIYAITGFSADDVWAVGTAGTIVHWDGTAWAIVRVTIPHPADTDLFTVWGLSAADLWIGGRNVLLYKGTSKLPEKSQ